MSQIVNAVPGVVWASDTGRIWLETCSVILFFEYAGKRNDLSWSQVLEGRSHGTGRVLLNGERVKKVERIEK